MQPGRSPCRPQRSDSKGSGARVGLAVTVLAATVLAATVLAASVARQPWRQVPWNGAACGTLAWCSKTKAFRHPRMSTCPARRMQCHAPPLRSRTCSLRIALLSYRSDSRCTPCDYRWLTSSKTPAPLPRPRHTSFAALVLGQLGGIGQRCSGGCLPAQSLHTGRTRPHERQPMTHLRPCGC